MAIRKLQVFVASREIIWTLKSKCDKFYDVKKIFRPRGYSLKVLYALFVIIPPVLGSSPDSSSPALNFREYAYGLTVESESHGSAIGAFYSFRIKPALRGLVQAKILNVAEGLPLVDTWTRRVYETGSANLVLVPVTGGVTYHPFEGQIANNFSPLLVLGLGPTFILNLAEERNFFDQWRHMETRVYPGAFGGVGVELPIGAGSFMTVILGYDFLPMGRPVDGREHYSGTVLKFMFGRRSWR